MGTVDRFQDLIAWQRARSATMLVYRWSAQLPADERFGAISQVRRAAISITSNIAEGFGRGSAADFSRCLKIARGSLFEVMSQVDVLGEIWGLAPDPELLELLAESDRVLQGLIRSVDAAARRAQGFS